MVRALKRSIFAAVLAGAFVSAPANAFYTVYTDLAAWQLAAGATSLEDFSGATVGVSTSGFGPTAFNGFSLSAVSNGDRVGIATGTIAGNLGDDTPIPAAFVGQNFFGWGNAQGFLNGAGNVGPTTTLTFAAATPAFGFDWFNTDKTDAYSVSLDNGFPRVGPPFSGAGSTSASSGFWGVVASAGEVPISTITIKTYAYGGQISTIGFDNVRVSAVPEPDAVVLMLGGFALVSVCALRKRRT